MTETLTFKVDCEWLCNFVRQRVFWEGMDFQWGITTLKESFGNAISDEDAFAILTGTKKIVGINGGDLVEDNKLQDYLDYVSRTEKKRRQRELEDHKTIYPLNYIDQFATVWSYRKFKETTILRGNTPDISECRKWFCQPPANNDKLFDGGLYSIDLAKQIVSSDRDREVFYQDLYTYWQKELETNKYTDEDRKKIRLRNRNYELWLEKRTGKTTQELKELIEKSETIPLMSDEEVAENDKKNFPRWVINDDNVYNLCEGSESYYQKSAKYVPLEPGEFFGYGLISPTGDFYACTFASHETAATVLCCQNGYFGKPPKDMPDGEWLLSARIEFRDTAKQILYDRGWVFVNSAYGYGGTFYSKWGDIENMPQKQMDTAFDFDVWERTTDPDDPRRRR